VRFLVQMRDNDRIRAVAVVVRAADEDVVDAFPVARGKLHFFLDLFAGIGLGEFLHHDHIALIHCGNEVLAVGTEMVPRQFQDIVVLTACGFHDHNHPGNICLDMKLLGTTVNIHQQQIV